MGSWMLQIIDRVGSAVNGSRTAVSGCGITSMSLSLIACQPRMLEPSKPRPSSKTSSSSLSTGIVKCCQIPGKSMNRRSTAFTFFSRQRAKTSLGVTMIGSFHGSRRQDSASAEVKSTCLERGDKGERQRLLTPSSPPNPELRRYFKNRLHAAWTGCATSRFLKRTLKIDPKQETRIPQFLVGAYDHRRQNSRSVRYSPRANGFASDILKGPPECKADASIGPDREPPRCLRLKFMT